MSEEFVIAYRRKSLDSGDLFISPEKLTDFIILENPLGYWAADPFLVEYNNHQYVFAELFNLFTGVGKIYCADLFAKKIKWEKCSIENCHLSFPNVFIKNNELFMIPETSELNSICLYKCIDFPKRWERQKVLMDKERFVDTAFSCDKKAFFTYIISTKPRQLVVFDENMGIIKTYIDENNCLRPAGNLFMSDKKNIFPAQISKNHYGEGIIFYKVVDDYIIENGITIKPNELRMKYKGHPIIGCHTYNQNKDVEIVDLKYKKISILRIAGYPFRKIFKTRK